MIGAKTPKFAFFSGNSTPPPNDGLKHQKPLFFSRNSPPLRQLSELAEGGGAMKMVLEVRVFLAFRQLPGLAESP